MNRIKTVIVDDEELARKRIKKLLSMDNQIHIVAEFDMGKDAITFIDNHQIDLLYLDIHMPEIDGFSVLKNLDASRKPFIIFATADKESAIKAFENHALDYLLKPFRNERFYESLEKAKEFVLLKNKAKLSDHIMNIVDNEKKFDEKPNSIINKDIDFDDVIYAHSDRNYLKIFKSKSDYSLVRKTMQELLSELSDSNFIQIHRSIIVNKYFIEKIDYIGNNEFTIHLGTGIILKSSRSFKRAIEKLTS